MDPKKKKILLISLAALVLLMITTIVLILLRSPRSEEPTGEVEIVYWGLWESDVIMHPLIEKYEAENPGVKILYSEQSYRNYESRVYTRLEQATSSSEPAPDVIRIHNSWLPKYEEYLTYIPDTVMTRGEYSEAFYPTALSDFTGRDGNLYAIPLQIDGLMIIYNKDLLSQIGYSTPPRDWDSFIELAQKLTKRNSSGTITQSGLAIGTSKNITNSSDILFYFMLQNKVELMDSTRTQINLTSSRAISAFDTYTSFVDDSSPTWAIYLPNDLTSFENGSLAMMFGTTSTAYQILEEAPEIKFGLAPLPRLPNNEEVYYSTYWADAVSNTCEYPQEAWKFIKYLSEPEQQRRLFQNASKIRAFGEPYSRVSMNSELQQNTYTRAIAVMAPYMKSWQLGDQAFIDTILKEGITQVIEEEKDSDSVLSKIQKEINTQLAVSNN